MPEVYSVTTNLSPGGPFANSICFIQLLDKFSVLCMNPAYICFDIFLAMFITTSDNPKAFDVDGSKVGLCLNMFKVSLISVSY